VSDRRADRWRIPFSYRVRSNRSLYFRCRNSMAKTLTDIRSLARSHTRSAILALAGVMRSKDASHAARVSAATALLDRGWGRPPQALQTNEDGALELIHRIERVIVRPDAPEGDEE
jgi:hypothetical protein